MTLSSGKQFDEKYQLNSAGLVLTLTTQPTITAGRLYAKDNNKEEWVDFNGVSLNADGINYDLTITGRAMSQTAIPSTSTGNGEDWIAGTIWTVVAMHDQIANTQADNTFTSENTYTGNEIHTAGKTTYTSTTESQVGGQGLTTTERDALTGVEDGDRIYNTTTGQTEWREGGAWVANDTGGTVANASETVAGKVEQATATESRTPTDTGGTGATNFVKPSDIAINTQDKIFTYQGTDTGASDAYAITLTPTLTAYAEGQEFTFKASNANTGASTIDIDTLGVKSIVNIGGGALGAGDIITDIVNIKYDGTNFVLQNPATLVDGSNADALHTHVGNKVLTTTLGDTVGTGIHTETTRITKTITGGVMGTTDALKIGFLIEFIGGTGSNSVETVNLKIDGSTVATFTDTLATGTTSRQYIEFIWSNNASASAQTYKRISNSQRASVASNDISWGTSAVDTTSDFDIILTTTIADFTGTINIYDLIIEKLEQ